MTEKTLYLNGKSVCTYTAPADHAAEIDLCRQLLKDRGLWNPVSAEVILFGQAVAFANAAHLVFEKDLSGTPVRNGHSAGSFVVNSAFATELYLKTLGLLFGRKMHGHDLSKLFRELPPNALADIGKHLARLVPQDRWSSKITSMADLGAVLQRHRNTFKNWRYLHEREQAEEFNFKEAIFTLQVLHEACRAHHMISPPAPTMGTADQCFKALD